MNHNSLRLRRPFSNQQGLTLNSLHNRSEEVLVAVATLGLVAAIVDGEATYREIESFTQEFRKRFALSRRQSLKLIAASLARIRNAAGANCIDHPCEILNEHLNTSQKIRLFDALTDVVIADGKIHAGEEYFLDYVAARLDLITPLAQAYPSN